MKREVITSIDPKSPVSEVFRALRTNLQYLNKKDGAQTILLTSTVQGEGKSFVAANLAVTFAQAGKNVVLVDSDMRRPRQHRIFENKQYPGLSNFLSGVDVYSSSNKIMLKDCLYETEVSNLFLLPAGVIPPNPSELLQSEKLPDMIEELKKVFDVVIFDGAPCILVTDATLVSRLVDATILVTTQGKTKIEDLKEAKKRIKRVGGNIAGVVLNRVKVSGKKYGERYYYSSANADDERSNRFEKIERNKKMDEDEDILNRIEDENKQEKSTRHEHNRKRRRRRKEQSEVESNNIIEEEYNRRKRKSASSDKLNSIDKLDDEERMELLKKIGKADEDDEIETKTKTQRKMKKEMDLDEDESMNEKKIKEILKEINNAKKE